MTDPVVHPDWGEARWATASATSSGVPGRPRGMAAERDSTSPGLRRPSQHSVSGTKPGATASTVIPSPESSADMEYVQALMAGLAAPYEPEPRNTATELIATMRPQGARCAGAAPR